MNKNVFLLLLGLAIVPAGCTMAPKYTRPKAPVPAEWPNGAAYASQLSTNNCPTPGMAGILHRRETSTSHRHRLDEQPRLADCRLERGTLPGHVRHFGSRIVADGQCHRQREQTTDSRRCHGLSGTVDARSYDANLGVASWEIDFFGRIRSFKNEALQEYLATEQARRSAQILLVSSVANAYLTLAADRENLALAETTLTSQQDAYNLIKRRHDLDLVSDLDLYRVQTQVDAARRDVARYRQQAAQDENALNLLVGSSVPGELLPTELNGVTPPKEISPGLSSEVLLRRPDVLQAEDLLKAANADIGAARAAFFPRISLTAAIGASSSELSGLFKAGSGAWSYAPQIVMPIFDARTWSAHKAAKVQREIAVTQYEKAIQSAFREVADALAVRGTVDQQVAAQQSLVNAFAETYRLSNSRYDKGIDNYLSVLDAQRSLFAAQQELVYLRLAKLANQVQLYAVLGGGWLEYSPQP